MITEGMQVSLRVKMFDSEGTLVGEPNETMVYVHGADEIFPRLEQALDFGDYDEQLLRVEERNKFPEELQVGMQFEGSTDEQEEDQDENDEDPPIFRVTDITEDTVVLDANHPLAGMALRFELEVLSVEQAPDEQEDDEDGGGDDEGEFVEVKRTLH
jgi:FKBP-type peptidyl-prolyl cis-trans isomerase SlyD